MNNKQKAKLHRPIAEAAVFLGALGCCGTGYAAEQATVGEAAAPASIWERDTLTGDWGGLRAALKDTGTDITLGYVGEGFDVISGGLRRRSSYEGRFEFSVDSDLDKAIGWPGAKAHVTIFNIHHGGSNVAENTGSLADPSNIDGLPTTRLFTAWLEQSLWNDHFSIRAGQLAADDEFFTSPTAGGLINGTFGWAGLMSADMTNGGPAYPVATPGIRLKFRPTDRLTALAAAFNGDPAGRHCDDDPQRCNRHGTKFPLGGGTLWMGELQYGVDQSEGAEGLPGLYKLGAWYSDHGFADQRYGLTESGASVPVSDPALDSPLNHRGDWGLYGVVDQTIWKSDARSLSVFLRGGFSPSNRNLVSYYADGGFGLKGLFASRPDDRLTLGVAYAKISQDAAAADRDAVLFNDASYVARSSEIVYELNYTAQITPWWTLQPDLQYIVRPNGGQNPGDPTRSMNHAFIVGLRTTIAF
ncbi:MAG: carbohydrate porin [Castellaniella sp.]|uniref:carbohydrate porin n=1 Tax=Castellaniella sp. TaxID=1955812 RepID=UPI00120B4ED1|nr:carbohydrate porin [Castellaniella sp.]TAN29765.1 MAG: carbohydrate porin [Castellaniella sp.]